jgi:hypothetical protein
VFTARYALSPYIKQIRSVFKGLIECSSWLVSVDGIYKSQFDSVICVEFQGGPLHVICIDVTLASFDIQLCVWCIPLNINLILVFQIIFIVLFHVEFCCFTDYGTD